MAGENFWTDASEEHQQLAEAFYRNIEYTHPDSVTSRGMCPCLDYSHYCPRAATSVTYYDYTGPAI